MASKRPFAVKITDSVLKDCYPELKRDLSVEIIDHLWTKKWLTDEERCKIKSFKVQHERNEELINILRTK